MQSIKLCICLCIGDYYNFWITIFLYVLNLTHFAKNSESLISSRFLYSSSIVLIFSSLSARISKPLPLITGILADAIEITCNQRVTNLCSIVAQKYKKTDASVERAMQTAINHAWRNTDIESLERYYTTYINPQKGVPTVMEFIYYYSSKIKKSL